MPNPELFQRAGPFTLGHLAELVQGTLSSPDGKDRLVHDVAPIDRADSTQISFAEKAQFLPSLASTGAGAVIIRSEDKDRAPADLALILVEYPYKAFALVTQAFYPTAKSQGLRAPGTVIDPTANIAEDVDIGANSVIGAHARIASGTRIGALVSIGSHVEIGRDCMICDQVSVSHASLGDRVTLHPGVRVGQDGFGFAIDPAGHVKIPQLGRVIIGDSVEIGANTTIDRGTLGDTEIGPGTWLDNLIQIGHNVKTGRGCVMAGQAGLAGGVELGDFVFIGGQAGIAGHLKVGTGAQIAAQAGVMGDVPAGAKYGGFPAKPLAQVFREVATLKKLSQKTRDNKSRKNKT